MLQKLVGLLNIRILEKSYGKGAIFDVLPGSAICFIASVQRSKMFGNVYTITFDKGMFREKIVNVVEAQENTNFDIYLPGTNEIYIPLQVLRCWIPLSLALFQTYLPKTRNSKIMKHLSWNVSAPSTIKQQLQLRVLFVCSLWISSTFTGGAFSLCYESAQNYFEQL